jgi:hypothetical protein
MLAFVTVLTSITAAITLTGPRRFYWRGFALFAGTYFLLMLLLGHLWVGANGMVDFGSKPPKPIFFTSYLLAWSHDRFGTEFRADGDTVMSALQILRATRDHQPTAELHMFGYDSLMTTGHSLFTIYFGLIGGWISSWFRGPVDAGKAKA